MPVISKRWHSHSTTLISQERSGQNVNLYEAMIEDITYNPCGINLMCSQHEDTSSRHKIPIRNRVSTPYMNKKYYSQDVSSVVQPEHGFEFVGLHARNPSNFKVGNENMTILAACSLDGDMLS